MKINVVVKVKSSSKSSLEGLPSGLRECVKQGTCVNVKLEIFVGEFVNLDLCVNVKHDDILESINYKFRLRNLF